MLNVVTSYLSYHEYITYVVLFTMNLFTQRASWDEKFHKKVCDPANCVIYNVVENGASQRMLFGILMGHFLVNLSLVTPILQKLLALGKLDWYLKHL